MDVFEGLTTLVGILDQLPVFSSGKPGKVRYTGSGMIFLRRWLPLKETAAGEPMLMDCQKFPKGHSQFKDILRRHAPIERVWTGPAYRFPDRIDPPANAVPLSGGNAGLLRGNFAKMVPELDSGHPCFAAIEDSDAVSICQSVRSSWRAHEAGVDTLETYRQRGYAVSTVAAWAIAVRELDLVPLYSTSWKNLASQRLARRLGLIQYGVDYHLT